jgi:hypothetical protein
MFQHIYQSDIVVVDITTSNANVYYELGIRHALAKGVTLLIRRKGTTIPFNIQGLQVVEYDQAKFGSIEQAKARIREIITNGLGRRLSDSPVHAVLDLNIEPEGKPLEETVTYEARLRSNENFAIGLITGDILNIRAPGVDVWVNSENVNMKMARPFENSISGVIRYLGAAKEHGRFKEDTIANELDRKMGGEPSVDPATVLVTTSGALRGSHGVKRIFHVAANYGQVGRGYVCIDNVARCVVNALSAVKELSDDCAGEELGSILFPLMGTRSPRGSVLVERVQWLFNAAIDYLGRDADCTFRKVYFQVYTDQELEVCKALLEADTQRLMPLNLVSPPKEEPVDRSPVTGNPESRQKAAPAGNGAVTEAGDTAFAQMEPMPSTGKDRPAPAPTPRKPR